MDDIDKFEAEFNEPTPETPVKVWQHGRVIGTLPPGTTPQGIRSNNFFYDPRPNDFEPNDDGLEVKGFLGIGDLGSIVGFRFGSE